MDNNEQDIIARTLQVIDPHVSEIKYKRELSIFLKRKNYQNQRGIILLESKFPYLDLMFLAPQLIPNPVVFTVRINFTNYDLEPLSISFINPLNGELVKANQMLTHFQRKLVNERKEQTGIQPLIQSETPDGIPFFCIPGVREYHNHPAHTGDSWFLHRQIGGEGSLNYLIDKLHEYGIAPLSFYTLQIVANTPQLHLNLVTIPE